MKAIKSVQKASLVIALMIGFTALSHAQLGIRVGGVLSNQISASEIDGQNYRSKVGLDLAAVFAFNLGPIALQPELHFIQKGSTLQDLTGFNEDTRSTLNYLEVPVLVKLNLGSKAANFHVLLGPSVGYLASGSIEVGDIKEDLQTNGYNSLEFGGHVGAGVKLGSIAVDVRYIVGFSEVPKLALVDRFKNNGLSAGVSLYF